jgi:hypothetical protein
MLALDGPRIQVLSIMGAESAVKAFAAVLQGDGHAAFRIQAEGVHPYQDFCKDKEGYSVYRSRASLNHWHFLCFCKREGLLTSMDEASVWRELRRFTTPLLRSWMPYVVQQLKDRDLLSRLDGFGCDAGLLTADSDALDDIVTEGLANRKIVIE